MDKSLENIVSYSNYQNRVVYNQQVVEAAKADAHLHLEKALTNDGVITDAQKITFFEKYQLPSYHNLTPSQMEAHKILLKEQFIALIEQQKTLLEGPRWKSRRVSATIVGIERALEFSD